jgi:DNA polymerase III sliding clamp (beta) subunit (PCNA family)
VNKVYINEKTFDKMLKAVGSCVAKVDINRPELTYIKLAIRGDEVTAYSCDSYSGARMKFNAIATEGEDFDCIIKPISFKVSKQGCHTIEITLEDKVATVDVPTNYGTLSYKFDQKIEYKTDLEKIFNGMKAHDREIGVNSTMLARIAKSFSNVLTDRNKAIIIETKDSKTQGFCIRAEDGNCSIEQFICPGRIRREDE